MRWAARCRDAFVAASGLRAVRHRPGRRRTPDLRAELGGGAGRDRLRRLRHRRPRGRRGPGRRCSRVLDATVPLLPADRPRYLMGVGKPDDLVGAVARGIDMFDCVLPTRSGRTGQAFTRRGPINLRNARHADDPAPARRERRLPGQPRLQPRLPASPGPLRRDPRRDAAHLAQLAYYQQLMARHARGDRGGELRRFSAGVRRRAGARRHRAAVRSGRRPRNGRAARRRL